jgi:hypothetical protein
VKLRFRSRRVVPRARSSSSCPGRARRRGGSWHPKAWPRNPITLHSIAYSIPAHPQQPHRAGHIAPALHQCLPDLHRLRWQCFFWHRFPELPDNSHGGLWSHPRLIQTGQCLRVDLPAPWSLCILSQESQICLHRQMKAAGARSGLNVPCGALLGGLHNNTAGCLVRQNAIQHTPA